MTASTILAEWPLTDTMQGVRDHFERGGSFAAAAAVIAVCVAALVLTYWLTRRLGIRAGKTGNPQHLFHQALDGVPLSPPQRSMLTTVAIAQGLEHPATLLLSRPVFDSNVDSWLGLKRRKTIDSKTKAKVHLARELRALLYPPRS